MSVKSDLVAKGKRDMAELNELREWVTRSNHRHGCKRLGVSGTIGQCSCGLSKLQKKWGLPYEPYSLGEHPTGDGR